MSKKFKVIREVTGPYLTTDASYVFKDMDGNMLYIDQFNFSIENLYINKKQNSTLIGWVSNVNDRRLTISFNISGMFFEDYLYNLSTNNYSLLEQHSDYQLIDAMHKLDSDGMKLTETSDNSLRSNILALVKKDYANIANKKTNRDKNMDNTDKINAKEQKVKIEDEIFGMLGYITNSIHENTGNLSTDNLLEYSETLAKSISLLEDYSKIKEDFKNKFIVFEGIDGSGKTTYANALVEKLNSEGIDAIYVKNISDGPIGELVREVLKSGSDLYVNNKQIASLFISEMYVVNETIKQHIQDGKVVVCDRWLTSTIAYAGDDDKTIKGIELMGNKLLIPDYTLHIEVDPHIAAERINERDAKTDIYDDLDSLKYIHDNYINYYYKISDDNHLYIDNNEVNEDINDIVNDIYETIKGE